MEEYLAIYPEMEIFSAEFENEFADYNEFNLWDLPNEIEDEYRERFENYENTYYDQDKSNFAQNNIDWFMNLDITLEE